MHISQRTLIGIAFSSAILLGSSTASFAATLQFACVKAETESYPVQIEGETETKIKVASFRSRTTKALRKTQGTVKKKNVVIKRLRKSRKGLSKKQKTRINKKIARLVSKVSTQKLKLADLKKRLKLISQCKNGEISPLYPQILLVESYSLAANETASFASSLEIRAEQSIEVAGTLRTEPGSSGSLTLKSLNGDLTIGDSATVSAGDGSAGTVRSRLTQDFASDADGTLRTITLRTLSGGGGAPGGDVILGASNGTLRIGDGATIHIGNGGDGEEITLESTSSLPGGTAFEFENEGGDSGGLYIEAGTVEGLDVTPIDDDGVPGWELENDDKVTGGIGGKPGSVVIGSEENRTRQFSEQMLPEQMLPTRFNWKHLIPDTRVTRAGKTKYVVGRDGAHGFFTATNGADASVWGKRGTRANPPGEDVSADGGIGGTCLTLTKIFGRRVRWARCNGGNGGSALAVGGDGAKGKNPDGAGGKGGLASASAGFGGTAGGKGIDGKTGSASAVGGNGGTGGGTCPNAVVFKGGSGGGGGPASANALSVGTAPGVAIANGGNGGKGGEGRQLSGTVGSGSISTATGGPGSAKADGVDGTPGIVCPGSGGGAGGSTPSPTPTQVGMKSVTVNFEDACVTSGYRDFSINMYIPLGATNIESELQDPETEEALTSPLCPGASESITTEENPSGSNPPSGKKTFQINIRSSDASTTDSPMPVRFAVTWD